MLGPSLPTPALPIPELFLARPVAVPGMPDNTQRHLVFPLPGSVVSSSADSLVPAGTFDQRGAGIGTTTHVVGGQHTASDTGIADKRKGS